jgi:exonuclease III
MVSMDSENILFWNVRSLGRGARRNVVADMVRQHCISVVCLQETKMPVIDDPMIYGMLGTDFSYAFVPTEGSRGGILVAWRSSIWSGMNIHISMHALTLRLSHHSLNHLWWLTVVYGPPHDDEKEFFLQELRVIRSGRIGPWLVVGGDFNLIYKAEDKNNARLNRQLMGKFCCPLQDLELVELHLHGRLYTWRNERVHPTLERIDRAFACTPSCDLFLSHKLRATSSSCSDHAPLALQACASLPAKPRFKFETMWPKFLGYLEAVAEGWQCTVQHGDCFRIVDHKFRSMAKASNDGVKSVWVVFVFIWL